MMDRIKEKQRDNIREAMSNYLEDSDSQKSMNDQSFDAGSLKGSI